ncbi:MAG: signal peptidase II, partial [Oscillospiraceae bacterium]|nr:signal peptidase II [Oscillospiraceae bacterium]
MIPVIIAALLLVLDQLTKFIASHFVELNNGTKTIIPSVLQMVNVRNDGSALSFITGNKVVFLALLALMTVLSVVLVAKVLKTGFARTSLLILLAGVLGNGLDLALFGYVTDMFELLFLPNIIFNLADILLGLGAVLFCLSLFFSRGREEDEDDEDDEDYEDDEDEDEDERPRRGFFSRRRRDDDEDEDEEDDEEEDEEDERPRRGLFSRFRRDDDDDDDE